MYDTTRTAAPPADRPSLPVAPVRQTSVCRWHKPEVASKTSTNLKFVGHYSYRSATSGSTLVARRASPTKFSLALPHSCSSMQENDKLTVCLTPIVTPRHHR